MIQAALSTKKLNNSDSLPEMRTLLKEYSRTEGDLNFLKSIHIAGSKGKGSVCAFTEQILRCKGFRTGLFTSPHLVHPRERIRIDGKPVSEQIFAEHVLRLDEKIKSKGDQISFFRFIWILALDIFKEAGVEVGIIEVGMGGRFDATNVIENPIVCGITSLAMEHINLLGPTILEIAWNKAGIIKPSIPIFSVKQSVHPETEKIIRQEADMKGSPIEFIETCDWIDDSWNLGINGGHQRENAALATALTETWMKICHPELSFSKSEIKSGLNATIWPGRQQKFLVNDNLNLFLDGSHTFESISATIDWFIQNEEPSRRNVLFFHCSPDRDYIKLLDPLLLIHDHFSHVYFLIPSSFQGEIQKVKNNHVEMKNFWINRTGSSASVITEIPQDIDKSPTSSLICGSLYLVGHFMSFYSIES